jgi:hypothetical protein
MTDVLIVQQFEILIINIFGMHIGFIILQVSTIMEVPLVGSQIGPCLKCKCFIIITGGTKEYIIRRFPIPICKSC